MEPKKVLLPEIVLGGCLIELKDKKLPWKKSVPWYKLARAIYKTGKDFGSRIITGNNTFTLVLGDTILPLPFYATGKEGFAARVFAAAEYIQKNNIDVDHQYCLEREFRKDGRNADRIELYISLA